MELNISRTAISKRIRTLERRLGLDIYSVKGKGYKLSEAIELLDADKIRQFMTASAKQRLSGINVFTEIDSTNMYLARELDKGVIHGRAVLAEFQQSGKGRRGNSWVSSFASGVCLSIGWQFQATPASLNALSLATGAVVCRCLRRLGLQSAQLKWPNDIVCGGQKLGGILIETRSETGGASDVILGLGLNVRSTAKDKTAIDQPVTSINEIAEADISRNRLVAAILDEVSAMLDSYPHLGFASYLEEWRSYDALKGRRADIIFTNESLNGVVGGITENGMLQMNVDGEERVFSSGEISLRAN